MKETKFTLIEMLMSWNEQYHNCGRRGSDSYAALKKEYSRMTKKELEEEIKLFIDADDATERELW